MSKLLRINDLVDPKMLEKMSLAKRVGQFLNVDQPSEDRKEAINVAHMLMEDVCVHVREVFAWEVRSCEYLTPDLAEKIARDVEEVSSDFLMHTPMFKDEEFAALITTLEEYARVAIARRHDLGELSKSALFIYGGQKVASLLVRNDAIRLDETALNNCLGHHKKDRFVMDQLSIRDDLPLSIVEQMIDLVSDHCRVCMMQEYAVGGSVAEKLSQNSQLETMWQRIKVASPQQVHAYVNDLRINKRLNPLLALEMGERGSRQFVYSFLALNAKLSIIEVKDILTLHCTQRFVELMSDSRVSHTLAPRFLRLAKIWLSEDNNGEPPLKVVGT